MMRTRWLLLPGLLLAACSIQTEPCTNVAQSSIYQSLSATFDDETSKTSASAQFRFGGITGTTLEMDGNCSITHDSITLTKDGLSGLLGTSYGGSKTGETLTHSFTFTDNDLVQYVNSGTIKKVAFSRAAPTTISRAGSVTVSWTPATDADTAVHVTVQQSTPGSETSYTKVVSSSGETSTLIEGSNLSQFANGTHKIYLTMVYSPDLSQATSEGGQMNLYHTTAHEDITLTD